MVNKDNYIKLLKAGNVKALDFFVDNYSNLIFKVAYGVLNNRELSKECLNEVLLKIWNNAKYFDKSEEKFTVWVMAISKYTAIDTLRKERKHSNSIEISELKLKDKMVLENIIEDRTSITEIKDEINKMKDIDREIFLRKFFNDEQTKDISDDLGVTESFINLRIFRGRKKLAKILKGEEV